MNIRQATPDDRAALEAFLIERTGSTIHVADGEAIDITACEAMIAGDFAGVLTFRVDGRVGEILTFNAVPPLAGIGSELLSALLAVLRARNATELFVTTTNDNVNALRFYQRRGFRLTELRPGAMEEARRIKPAIGREGRHGIELRDELVLTLTL